MDYLPRAFYDDVFGQLEKKDIGTAQELKGAFGRVAADHYGKRRELGMYVAPTIKTKLCTIQLLKIVRPVEIIPVPLSNLNSNDDRITHIFLSQCLEGETMSFNEALTKIFLALHIAPNSGLLIFDRIPDSTVFMNPFFKLLGRSHSFKSVITPNCGEECEGFVRKQLKSVHLEELWLHNKSWPADFQSLVASWTENPNFRRLHSDSKDIMLDYETAVSLLKRWANGELKKLAVDADISFKKEHLYAYLQNLGCTSNGSMFKLSQRRDLEVEFRDDRMFLDIRE
ncbi:hypothetical protein QR680_016389 [Steinernema hermaphroditum]|uniref:Uncharacterized protein n=1 Tax=Steinernema hermaphroditum TaxID=289476 RepID=A0AA39HC67_9BILA|nr:hypothetical protein QR680_016389 [Steinernema hermaphroditum]